jgi:monofunctional biosynthetic peptidoglycan transglycosylase
VEIYLNIAEWGPGIFGAEAAARYHFQKSAKELTRQEAAQLAAALPNPIRRHAGHPGPRTASLASRLRHRAARERQTVACVLRQ